MNAAPHAVKGREVWVLVWNGQYLQSHNTWSVSHATARKFDDMLAAHEMATRLSKRHPNIKLARQTVFEQPS